MKYFLPLIIALSIFINPINVFAEELILAGGCFWCLEHDLESLKGINSVKSGYSGGDLQNPTYENHDGHQEVVLVDYDSQLVTLPKILSSISEILILLMGRDNFVIAEILTGQLSFTKIQLRKVMQKMHLFRPLMNC